MMSPQKRKITDLFIPIRVDNRTFYRCRDCGKIVRREAKVNHIERKHPEIDIKPPERIPPPDRIREAWIRWYESGPHNADLSARLEFSNLTVGSMEPEISRMHVRTGVLEKCPRCGHTWERLSKVGGKSTCPHCGKHYEQEAIA